jgi:hypothetical protein
MPTSTLRRRLLLPALVLSVTAGIAAPAPVAAAEPEAAAEAATWLAGELTEAGTVVGSFPGSDGQPSTFTDYGRSIDAALALLVAGRHDDVLGRTLTTLTSVDAVKAYTQGAPFDRADAAYAGATAKLAFLVEATGGDATNVGAVDLLAQLEGLIGTDGRLTDRSEFGSFANLFGQSFAILAFDAAGRSNAKVDSLVQGLLTAQCPDGSFPQDYEPKSGTACTGSVDATGLALQALAALQLAGSQDAQQARTWLVGQQRTNGDFPGEAPVNSTGYAAMGLAAVGDAEDSVSRASTYLATQQNPDGGLQRGAGPSEASDVFATAQALPALLGTTYERSIRTVALKPIPCRTAVVTLATSTINATGSALVTVTATSGTLVDLFAYSQPSTEFKVVRSGTVGKNGVFSAVIKPATNTRLYAKQHGCADGAQVVLNVRTTLTLAVVRNGVRNYTFSGDSLPARAGGLIVSLYRVAPDGREILTAQTRADARTGEWTLRRVFTSSGRFGFVVRTGQDLQNAPGRSNVRTLLVF